MQDAPNGAVCIKVMKPTALAQLLLGKTKALGFNRARGFSVCEVLLLREVRVLTGCVF